MSVSKNRLRRFSLQRLIQSASLFLFLYLLQATVFPLSSALFALLPPEAFLHLDPLAAIVVPISAREFVNDVTPGLLILLLAIFFGRLFCGYVCPLGTTLDFSHIPADKIFGKTKPHQDSSKEITKKIQWLQKVTRLRYLLLAIILGSALMGMNQSYWLSPIPLITRFYALLLHPLLLPAAQSGLDALKPLLAWLPENLDMTSLQYLQIPGRHFYTLYFLLAFFGLLFWLERIRPRFWCRYLCPAGALLSLMYALPRKFLPNAPYWGRKVSACKQCGKCAALCPMGAIGNTGDKTKLSDCVACRSCAGVCPVRAVTFGFTTDARCGATAESEALLPSRRSFLTGAGAGVLLAGAGLSGTGNLLKNTGRGSLWAEDCVRPPGALPETDFLRRCVRCGECMKVCPSNGLQPFFTGLEGLFAPVLLPRRGPCEPDCNACGAVCPTGAITALPLHEKQWAKLGTAVIVQGRCLAYAEGRRCVVCQEVCPYGAIRLEQQTTSGLKNDPVTVPVVDSAKCFGCGYCEHHCPVRIPAVVIYPLNALRLSGTDYKQNAQQVGLELKPVSSAEAQWEYEEKPDSNGSESGLPPGFTE
jgi:MauM/NapG family ferredoxin protein